MRPRWIFGLLCLIVGCQSLRNKQDDGTSERVTENGRTGVAEITASKVPEEPKVKPPAGAEVAPPQPKEEKSVAIAKPVSSTKTPEPVFVDHLMLAADCMEKNDTSHAADHLRLHIQKNPDQIMIRAYLADLLYKAKFYQESQWQFERFVQEAQSVSGPANAHLLHCHTRLMEIAEEREDDYAEHLNRGIGLYLLACKNAKDDSLKDENLTERVFLRATKELKLAAKINPKEARSHWYLYLCWNALNQLEPARKSYAQALELAKESSLTPKEKRDLQLLQFAEHQ